jgi:hypothetical protein
MSNYILRGRLCGALCDECFEHLAHVKVRIYRLRPGQDVTRLAVADPKDTFAVLTPEQIRDKASALLGEFETDESGNFTVELGKASKYAGEAFEIDVYCGTVPHRRPEPPPKGPVQFTITTVQPQWRERDKNLIAAWDYCLPHRFWCYIRSLFDAWVICGRVSVCATGEAAAGVKVFAFDRDWLMDDPLGFGFTDGTGKFRIDYLGADFRRGTWINVELFGGPDVYFRIESPSGAVLLAEPSSKGRSSGRENIGPCFCVDLCVEDPGVVRHAWFTRVGDFNIYSDISNTTGLTLTAQPNGFPNQHGGPGFGFWGSLKLIGDCPTTHPAGAQAMRYRFLTRPAGSAAAPTPITGAGMVDATKVGTRPVSWNFGSGVSIYPQDIYVAGSGGYVGPMPAPAPAAPPGPPPGSWGSMPALILQPDAQGWVTMPPDATNQGFSGPLLRLNSSALAAGGSAPGNGAGNPVSAANQRGGQDFEIVYEAEPIGGPAPSGPTLTNPLSRIHINNWIEVAQFELDQFTAPGATPCSGITNAVDIRYTMDHELVADWRLSLSTSATIPGGTPTLPGMGTPPLPPDQFSTVRGGNGIVHLNTTGWPQCAYVVIFSRRLKLTDGEIDDSGRSPMVAVFCKH